MSIKGLAGLYPHLFSEVVWGPIRANFHVLEDVPPAQSIANVNVVPFIDDKVLIIQLDDASIDWPQVPPPA